MKRLSPITALMVLAYSITTVSCQNGQGSANPPVFWDGGTIPDPVFRAYVLGRFDTDRNGKISREEADAVFAIDVDAETADTPLIESLTGVEYFKNPHATGIIWLRSTSPKIQHWTHWTVVGTG